MTRAPHGRGSAYRVRGRVRQVTRLVREHGPRAVLARSARALTRRLTVPTGELPVRAEDVLAARPVAPARPTARVVDRPMQVTWVMSPPAPGSGGHTTVLRLVQHLEARGHTCRVALYDRHGGDHGMRVAVLRQHWPGVAAEVLDATAGLPPSDAVFATSWPTAYVVARPEVQGRGFYLVQDWEPSFYATSSASVLAEASYQLGLHGVTVGRWLTDRLTQVGMASDPVDFGCDTDRYRVLSTGRRRDVVFYARPSAPRRGFELGVLALQLFAERCPTSRIHVFGERVGRMSFPVEDHGLLSVEALNELYNRCAAGLSLSLTNVSLTPLEKLAAGCLPVVNDAVHNRAVLQNPHVRWSGLTPAALAQALQDVVEDPAQQQHALAAAASVQDIPWSVAGAQLEHVLRRELSA